MAVDLDRKILDEQSPTLFADSVMINIGWYQKQYCTLGNVATSAATSVPTASGSSPSSNTRRSNLAISAISPSPMPFLVQTGEPRRSARASG